MHLKQAYQNFYCMYKAMQCDAMQCDTMQCDTM